MYTYMYIPLVNRHAHSYRAVASYLREVWLKSCDCRHTAVSGFWGMLSWGNFKTRCLGITSEAIFLQKKSIILIYCTPYGETFSDIKDSAIKHIYVYVSQSDPCLPR